MFFQAVWLRQDLLIYEDNNIKWTFLSVGGYKLMDYKGLRWYKCDFHLHTMSSLWLNLDKKFRKSEMK